MQTSSIRERNRGTCFKHTVNLSSCQQERRNEVYCFVSKWKELLAKEESWKIIFSKIQSKSSTSENQIQNRVSINHGLRFTHEMAIEHLDELGSMLIETGIAPDLKKIEPGVWSGKINTARIWACDETPQFINYKKSGLSRKKVYAVSGEDCNELTIENHECVTIQPFTNFKGNQALRQVIFSGSGHNSHMHPKSAAEKIPNLLISVNDSGWTDHATLNAVYKELEKVIYEKDLEKPIVIIADGHKS